MKKAKELILELEQTEQNQLVILCLEQLMARISILEANLMSVVLAYRRDMMREMRSGFDEDEFDEMVNKITAVQ